MKTVFSMRNVFILKLLFKLIRQFICDKHIKKKCLTDINSATAIWIIFIEHQFSCTHQGLGYDKTNVRRTC